MVKIRILKNLGVVGASALAGLGGGLVGCTAEVDDQATADSMDTAVKVGTGTISLDQYTWKYASTTAGGDEFIRVGEKLKVTVGLTALMYSVGLTDADITAIKAKPSLLKLTAYSTFSNGGTQVKLVTSPLTLAPSAHGDMIATSADLVVPSGAPHLDIRLEATYNNKTQDVRYVGHSTFAVFGAFLPNKLALFDNDSAGKVRARIVEGGALAPGKNVTISYTDWRADGQVDRHTLNTAIGEGASYNRFGPAISAILGALSYKVTMTYSTDGGVTWVDGGTLDRHDNPDVLNIPGDYGRSSYEKTFRLPDNAKSLEVAFHVQATMTADPQGRYVDKWYDAPGGGKYKLGQTYTLADKWDNNGGQNYKLAVH